MPAKLMPGTPSISAGTMMPCQWMLDISLRPLRTRSVTVSPSRRRRTGAGTLPFTAVAIRRLPVKLTGSSARSEEHTSELQSLMRISYAVFCLKKKKHKYEKKSLTRRHYDRSSKKTNKEQQKHKN